MPRLSLGFNQRNFNGTRATSAAAINMGSMRGKGSTSRMFNYCTNTSPAPSLCINQFINITGGGPTPTPTPTVPGAPVITSINGADGELQVFFTQSNDGGSPITDYLYSINNGITFISSGLTGSPLTIIGLTNGTTYDVRIKAVNSVGQSAQSNVVSGTPSLGSTWFYTQNNIPSINNWSGVFITSTDLDSTNALFTSYIYPTYQGTVVTPDPTYGTPRTVCYVGTNTAPLTGGQNIQPLGFYPSFNNQMNFSFNYTLSDFYPTDAKISINSNNSFAILYNTNNLQTNGAVLTTGGVMYGSNGSITENIIANKNPFFPPIPVSSYTYIFTDVYCGYDNISGNEFIIWMGRAPNGSYASPVQNQTRLFIYKLGASVFNEISLGITSPYLAPTVFQPYTSPTSGASCFACSNIIETDIFQSFNCWPKTFIIGTGITGSLLNGYIYLYVNITSANSWMDYTRTRGYINPTLTSGAPNTDGKSITSTKMKGDGTKIYATTVDGLYYASSNDALYTNLTFTTIDDNTNQYSSNGWSYISWLSLGVSSPINPQLSLSYDGLYLLVVFSSTDKPIRSGDGGITWQTINNINGQSGWDSFSQGAVCSVNPSGINQSIGWSYGTGTVPGTFKSSAISNDYGNN